MKRFYFIVVLLSCLIMNIKAAPLRGESTITLEMTYRAGGGMISKVEVENSNEQYAMRVWLTTANIGHIRIDWRDSGGAIVYSSAYVVTTNQSYVDVPYFPTDWFTIGVEYDDVKHGSGEILYQSEIRYYTVRHN